VTEPPHFSFPLTLAGGQLATVEQDSDVEIGACIAAILSWPIGTRPDEPTFGVVDQTFTQSQPDLAEIVQAVKANEPRAVAIASLDGPLSDLLVSRVRVGYGLAAS
jgi:hypothetical protein